MNWRQKVLDFDHIGDRGEGLKGLVFDIQKFAIHDGGGIRTLVFLKGCPLVCPWCSNPESLAGKPEITFVSNNCIGCGKCLEVCKAGAIRKDETGAKGLIIDRDRCTLCGQCAKFCYAGAINIIGRYLSVPELVTMIERDRKFYEQSNGGVTFSGGEPTAQPEFLKAALQAIQARGIHTAIETSSFVAWETFASILENVDLVLTDIKHMDDAEHKRLTGVSNKVILENIRNISRLGIPIKIRLPLIPGFNDSDRNLAATAEFVEQLSNVQSLDILPYHRLGEMKWGQLGQDYSLTGVPALTLEDVESRIQPFKDRGLNISIGG
ncbi:glycerol dehydratase-activating enzyme, putative [Syntrophotalea carbinolica DSM 2380]|uniref:Glycerol dehydratase-activating enzyme, putative n=1 Tax=Syntrophotalea carbinolica (strain DSM 2380 / NBRC 103641 / GraBd1) TaxID=338963 RepID=Q3A4R5_SYNC1|nr:glycyl-radical enzyme activating protein [Syntrophotalea carbinolica]ABA88642.1 glycerol dehydratase-activating enzyme, putative [Syntrophotalea carbinolica DSM 2380]